MATSASRRRSRGYAKVSKVRRILRMAPEAAREGIRQEMEEATTEILAIAKERAPKRTGEGAEALSRKVSRDGLSGKVGILGKRARRKGFHLVFAEVGTVKQTATPFLGPAGDIVLPKVAPRAAAKINLELRKLAATGRVSQKEALSGSDTDE